MSNVNVSNLFYINLDFRKDRKENIERQLKKCKWKATRVSAVRLEKDASEIGLKLQPHLVEKIHVAGIWQSHKVVLQKSLESQKEGVTILLEDDVRVDDGFWSEKLNLPKELPNDWEIILYSPRYRVNRNGPLKDYKGKKWLDAPTGTKPALLKKLRGKYIMTGAHFVVFNGNEVIRKVLTQMNQVDEVYDVDRFYLGEFNTYGIDEMKIGTGPFGSDHE